MLTAADPAAFLRSVGLTLGRTGRGLALSAAAVPVCLVAAFIGSRDPALREQYPFAKTACRTPATFTAYEAAYLVLYYLPWEFLYRGLLFLALVPALGLAPALALQTIISTIHHFGHPDTEIWAACGAGFIFGLVAWITGSFLYTVFIHALVGMATDTFICLRRRRLRTPERRPVRILVTGATGFVGAVLMPELAREHGAAALTALVLPGDRIPQSWAGLGVRTVHAAISPMRRP